MPLAAAGLHFRWRAELDSSANGLVAAWASGLNAYGHDQACDFSFAMGLFQGRVLPPEAVQLALAEASHKSGHAANHNQDPNHSQHKGRRSAPHLSARRDGGLAWIR